MRVKVEEPVEKAPVGQFYFQNANGQLRVWIYAGQAWVRLADTGLPATDVNASIWSVLASSPHDITESEVAAAIRRATFQSSEVRDGKV